MRNILYMSAVLLLLATACTKESALNNGGGSTGQGGSLARFTIVGNYLYTVDGVHLSVFDISNNNTPLYKNKIQVGFDIEAIFPFENKLFIASSTAMYIYSITNPEAPEFESNVSHLTGCDPIVANDSVAYLTIHGGNRCGSSINQLQVYNITNIAHPIFKKSINLTNPMGLGMKGNSLFVCDNGTGLRVFDITNKYDPQVINIITGETFVDVIPAGNLLICMLTNGVAYYDITDEKNIVKLGSVKN
jgi:hypothetical protein